MTSVPSDSASIGIIKEEISKTIYSLLDKREKLYEHKNQYVDLKFKLHDYNTYQDSDQPLVNVKIGPRALTTGIVPDAKKILVSLGDDYFVERDPIQAKKLLEGRISMVTETIAQFDMKIKEAKSTLQKLESLEKIQENANDPDDGKYNEEGLPFLDIKEALDEEGNITNISVNDKKFEREHIRPNDEPFKELLQGGDKLLSITKLDATDAVTLSNKHSKTINKQLEGKEFNPINAAPKIGASIEEKPNVLKHGDPETTSSLDDQFQEMLEDFEIIPSNKSNEMSQEIKDEMIKKLFSLNIKDEDKEQLKLIIESKHATDASEIFASIATKAAIAPEDILELELIADEFAKEEDFKEFEDDEDWDYEFEEGDEDEEDNEDEDEEDNEDEDEEDNEDEDEDEDEDDGGTFFDSYGSIVPIKDAKNLFWQQIMKNREAHFTSQVSSEDTRDTNLKPDITSENSRPPEKQDLQQHNKKKVKKSVSFSPSLQIKEVENISEDLKNIDQNPQKVSKFKQEMSYIRPVIDKKLSFNPMSGITEISNVDDKEIEDEEEENPVANIIFERKITSPPIFESESLETITETANESSVLADTTASRENPISYIIERIPQNDDLSQSFNCVRSAEKSKSVSRFKSQFKLKKQAENNIPGPSLLNANTIATPSKGVEINDDDDTHQITEKSLSENEDDTENLSHNTRNSPVADNSDEEFEELMKPKKVSRFRAYKNANSKGSLGVPVRIGIPSNLNNTSGFDVNEASVEQDLGIRDKKTLTQKNESRIKDINENNGLEVVNAFIDFQSMQEDMDTMAKAYVLGMYDEDIMTEGPVVDKIEDFEVLNKMVESMKPDTAEQDEKEKPANKNDVENYSDEEFDDVNDEEEEEDDGPILADQITENDIESMDEEEFFMDDDFATDDGFLQQEISIEYHKMRQNIIAKNNSDYRTSNEDKIYEPIDNGQSRKVSKFKAAKLNMNNDQSL